MDSLGPPYRAEHMGSLLRPQNLLDARQKIREQGLSPQEAGLNAVEKETMANVVKLQRDLGFKAIGSGEFTRTRFWGQTWAEFDGTTTLKDADASLFRLYHPDVVSLIEKDRKVMPGDNVIAGSKIAHNPEASVSNLHELKLIQQFVPKEEWNSIKLTMITPSWFHMRYRKGKAYSDDVYKSEAEYFEAVAKAYSDELDMLYKAGLRNVQFDDPNMAYFCSPVFRDGWAADPDNEGRPVDDLLDAYIKLYNDSIANCPADMHTGIHLCRGNFIGGRHFSTGSYDAIAEKLFRDLNVDTFYLEYDTARAGGFEPLQYLPKNKNVVVGVVSTKLPALEDKEEMKKRVLSAADWVAKGTDETQQEALQRVCVSPQCGFSTHESGYPLGFEEQSNKLALIREIADEIWGQP